MLDFLLLFIVAAVRNADSAVLSASSSSDTLCMLGLLSRDLLLLPFCLVLGVDEVFAVGEVQVYLVERGAVVLCDPGVLEDVGHLRAHRRVELEQASHQVLELLREILSAVRLVLRVRLPEEVRTVGADQTVEGVRGFGAGEGRVLRVHDEKDDGGREKID